MLKKIKNFINSIKELNPHTKMVHKFKREGGEHKRYDYDLNENSIVYDIGGYKGEWAGKIFNFYNCNIKIFEPVKEFTQMIGFQFKSNPKVSVYPFGLSNRDKEMTIYLQDDGSSIFKKSPKKELVEFKKASDYINGKIDLLKINIEGGEYEVLENLIENDLIKNIDNIQIQFHDFVSLAKEKREQIQNELSKTHYPDYNYPFVWESWKKYV